MWILCGVNNSTVFHFATGTSYTIGRKDCDIVIENDKSISRNHATITISSVVEPDVENLNISSTLSVVDLSKYGTVVNNVRLAANSQVQLNDGDTIQFGVYSSIYTLRKIKLVFCTSRVSQEDQQRLTQQVCRLDCKLLSTWDPKSCTHLLVHDQEVCVTEKIALAVINGTPVVKLSFVTTLANELENKSSVVAIPDARAFGPVLDLSRVVPQEHLSSLSQTISGDTKRDKLFAGKTFVFFNYELLKKNVAIIKAANGEVVDATQSSVSITADFFIQHREHCLVVEQETYPIEEAKYKLLQLLQFQFVTETNILAAIFTANIVTCSPKPPPVSVVSVFETPVASTSKMEKPKPVLILREEDKSDSDLEDNLQDKEEQRQNMAATNVKHEQQVTVPVPHNSQTQIRSRPKKDGSVSSKPQVEKITALNSLSHTKHGELGPNEGVRLVEQQETAPNKPEVSRLPKLGDNNPIIPQSHKKDAMQELPLPQQQNPEIYRINIEYLDLDIKPRKRDTIVEQPSPRGFNAKKFKKSAVGRMISSAKREMNSPPKNTSSSGSSSKGAEITDDILEMFIFQHATVAPPSGNTSVEDEYSQVDDDVKLFNFDKAKEEEGKKPPKRAKRK